MIMSCSEDCARTTANNLTDVTTVRQSLAMSVFMYCAGGLCVGISQSLDERNIASREAVAIGLVGVGFYGACIYHGYVAHSRLRSIFLRCGGSAD